MTELPKASQSQTPLIRAGVVGVGHLGKFHAEKYAKLPGVALVGLADTDRQRVRTLARQFPTAAYTDYRDLFGKIDCVSIAVPTQLHHSVARDFLLRGVDVLVEKPIAANGSDARKLVQLADSEKRILQVGHLERFNPALRSLTGILTAPRFIECHRVAPFVERGTDVDVVRDLMIHDLDVILSLVRSPIVSREAFGVPVLTEAPDIANVRLRFASGCIANVTASRVAIKRERKMRIFQPEAYLVIDYGEQNIRICRRQASSGDGKIPNLSFEERSVGGHDALEEEIRAFVHSVQNRARPIVSGVDGLQALEEAENIVAALELP